MSIVYQDFNTIGIESIMDEEITLVRHDRKWSALSNAERLQCTEN